MAPNTHLCVDVRDHPKALRRWAADSSNDTLTFAKQQADELLEHFKTEEMRYYLNRFRAIVEEELMDRLSAKTPSAPSPDRDA